ncbi:hypothetical protein EDF46_0760 [Frondihabitans sp. PhB188]|uniref:hypothetical protein n=1 Tax=Frondihabitans sp. PhB188 TaxID=2485200 RepID=UPI000F49BBF1|nr:hypothetical protein [Frondihabitans sp. PhB188]ROQ41382.1 hypothetical protein EDF46_0760 [Frondihabitans sp. PhB188]
MQIYSGDAAHRARQTLADVTALAGIVAFAVLGAVVAGLVATLAQVGRSIETAGSDFRSRLADAADTLGGVPLIGPTASAPLQRASDAGSTLVDAGQRQQEIVGQLSLIAGLVVALVPIGIILLAWLRPRLAFVRRARVTRKLAQTDGGLELLAFRALASGDVDALLRINPNPVAAWSAGDALEQRQLAELALHEAGVVR